jgi:hypothetical protein
VVYDSNTGDALDIFYESTVSSSTFGSSLVDKLLVGWHLLGIAEREDIVSKQPSSELVPGHHGILPVQAFETGPLKSEAQGLDLSVDIAGSIFPYISQHE